MSINLFKVIGHFFAGLFNSLEKAYNQLTPEQQEALKNGSGLANIVNQNLEASLPELRAAIQKAFPQLDEAALEKGVFQALQDINVTNIDSLDEGLAAIQKYLKERQDTAWAKASHIIASAFSIAFAPMQTKVATVFLLIEWVYHTFIKKD